MDLDLAPVNLGEAVESNVRRHRVLAAKKGIEISLEREREAELPRLRLDASKIEQVLDNVIGNAVKFSPPGSPVEVHLGRENGHVVISVADHGPGIPADLLGKLFEPFTRGGVREAKGAGLGLAIVKRIVAGHGGDIRVESEIGRGSTFRVCLPLGGAS